MPKGTCGDEHCHRVANLTKGLCHAHYMRQWYGSTRVGPIRPQHQRATAAAYTSAHQRVYADRGKASEHTCHCGQPAAQWAYDHQDPDEQTAAIVWGGKTRIVSYSLKPEHYVAMCRSCHIRADMQRKKAS